tara:strand:- start:2133 stop:2714 length:582 start_codon:yes stop_codon:yes gene_type:complete
LKLKKYIKYILILVPVFVVLVMNDYFSKKTLPVLGNINNFILYDQNGNEFSEQDLLGNYWISDFIFTTCAGPCPVMSSQFQGFQEKYSDNSNLKLLSISVNPQYDTPNILQNYGERYSADFKKWNFLTGDVNEIHTLALESFKVGDAENPIFHSAFFILIDDQAQIRGYYNSTINEDINKMYSDINDLMDKEI